MKTSHRPRWNDYDKKHVSLKFIVNTPRHRLSRLCRRLKLISTVEFFRRYYSFLVMFTAYFTDRPQPLPHERTNEISDNRPDT